MFVNGVAVYRMKVDSSTNKLLGNQRWGEAFQISGWGKRFGVGE
jgi:hypothetical protein